MEKDIYILAIESSCDETAAAVVKNGREVLSNVISSQIELHKLYGGVVPEIASRKHIEKINPVIREALAEADMKLEDMDAIGVTYGPGLVGALLVGVAAAKAISYAKHIPLVGVHHIEGHISANYIENKDLEPPFLGMVVSGGHTHLVMVKDYGKYEILGKTRDDAAGEAFDKVARAIGLGYPGGPKIDKLAKEGNPKAIAFPRAQDVYKRQEHSMGRTFTVMIQLDDEPGFLSGLLNCVAKYQANILTIHQAIPVNGVASVTLSIEILNITGDVSELIDALRCV